VSPGGQLVQIDDSGASALGRAQPQPCIPRFCRVADPGRLETARKRAPANGRIALRAIGVLTASHAPTLRT
jgi:hypothetical protein